MHNNMGWNYNDDWKVFWATSFHSLWSWHNKESHYRKFSRPPCQMTHINKLVQDYKNAKISTNSIRKHHRTLKLIKWEVPPLGLVELNTDGARDKKVGVCSAYIAELWGVYNDLHLVTRLRFRVIDMDVYSQQVVNEINTNKSSNIMGRKLISKIRSYFLQDCEIRTNHVY